MKTWRAVVVGGVVVAALMQVEQESPGATGRGTANLRGALTPAVSEAVGAAGDAVLVVRDEAQRQGLNPTGVFSGPTVNDTPDMNPRDVAELPDLSTEGE